jgi:hypothetical protein
MILGRDDYSTRRLTNYRSYLAKVVGGLRTKKDQPSTACLLWNKNTNTLEGIRVHLPEEEEFVLHIWASDAQSLDAHEAELLTYWFHCMTVLISSDLTGCGTLTWRARITKGLSTVGISVEKTLREIVDMVQRRTHVAK